ncbi:uncharacterized protein At4g18257-like isoform X1 [Rhodamnia argentea]|uniref:Uncharacterized protein At4g18257-like isoform X1 n=1 Tax=Rhodamnia argentea TaxID=178133 RepID=A0A8B8R2T3_9MYRT|nr:uncharacterized protein At4g18257-like isoform X1 [Rhodamnia argentea]
MADEERKKRVVESLGWLTESSIMPKKHRAIAGVGASSIMELKAQLYRSQEESKQSKDLSGGSDASYHRAKITDPTPDSFSRKNSGVEARAHKDKLELKAINDGSKSYEALEKKAALYDKLVKGELSDEEDQEKYCVDFFRKNLEHDDSQQPQGHDMPSSEVLEDRDDEASVLFETKFTGPGRTVGAMDRDEHKRFVREVHEEVNQAREKASDLKMRRQIQVEARREKLKQAYLRKQLDKLKATSGEEKKA